mgnify:CR=1 FL=1
MSIEVMVQQMTAGFGQTCLIFFLTLIFSLPLGMIVYFAAAADLVFRTVLSVGHEYRRL